jgi:diguanylate cyclase (GGDEF)-like protein
MDPLAVRLGRWSSDSGLPAIFAAVALAASVSLLNFFSVFGPESAVLLSIPVWLAAKMAGRAAGVGIAFFGAFCCTCSAYLSGNVDRLLVTAVVALAPLLALALLVSYLEDPMIRLRRLALRDPLTGLMNRRALEDLGLMRKARPSNHFVVVMIDCDGFKAVNDRFGHQAGDHILKILARTLKTETRSADLAIRMGGDEFALVLDGVNRAETETIMARTREKFERQVLDAGYFCTISVGIAGTDPNLDLDELLKLADEAMYQDKKLKRPIAPML